MTRGIKTKSFIREVKPDPLYGSKFISKMINYIMKDGKKSTASSIMYSAISSKIDYIKKFYQENHNTFLLEEGTEKSDHDLSSESTQNVVVWFFYYIINAVSTDFEVESKRVGGSNYQIPTRISLAKAISSAMKRIINAAKSRPEKTMDSRLAQEFCDICESKGRAIDAKELVLKIVEANKPFAHFASYQ